MIIGVGLDGRLKLPFGQLREAASHAAALGLESLLTALTPAAIRAADQPS